MIKRPFLWGIIAFIGGILSAYNKVPILLLAIVGFICWLLIYILMFHLKKYINRKDYFLWGLPLLMLIGFLAMTDRMKPPDMDMAFGERSDCILTGKITMIVKKSWGSTYYLKNNKITLPDDSTYLVEEIVVNRYMEDYQKQYLQSKALQSQNSQLKSSQFQSSLSLPLQLQKSQYESSQPQSLQSPKYHVGNIITVSGTIKKFLSSTNPGGFDEELYYKAQNISYKVNAKEIVLENKSYSRFHYILNYIKEELVNVYSRLFPKEEAGALMAMLLGEKYLLEDEIRTLYQENGISHILVISGLHVSMLGAAIYLALKKLGLGLIASTVLSLMFVYSYGILTNFSVSTNRAVVMYSVMLLAKLFGKTFDILSALSLSAFLILIQNPMDLFQAGFLLSFGAVLGIAVILPGLNSLHEAKNSIQKSIYVSISAQTLTLPFILYYFFQIPVYSVLINLIILPLSALLILTALIAGVTGLISISLGVFIAGGAKYILSFYEMVCRLASKAPGSLITVGRPNIFRIIVYLLIILVFLISARRYRKKRLFMLLVAAIVALIIPRPRDGLTITMLDVGQGEAIFMESDLGTTYLVDGGSSDVNQVGRYRIEPYLLSRGTDTIDYVIITHTDEDHVSGLMELIEGKKITIKSLAIPNTSLRNEAYIKLEALARDKNIKLRYIVAGDMIIDGKLQLTFLHPPVGYQPASNNDYSTVIGISYDEFDMLLTGDIEAKGERELIDVLRKRESLRSDKNYLNNAEDIMSYIQTDYDALKVAHHGSKNSTSEEFLTIIRPELSLISCAENSRYGHPHSELLDRLDDIGSEVVITYESGAITIMTDGKRMVVEEYLK